MDSTRLNAFLISSETGEFTIHDIVEEFNLELLDDYWIRCRTHRATSGHLET